MKVCVFGAGAIGSLFAALLSKQNDVFVVCREAHANAINSSGLAVSGIEEFNSKIPAYTTAPNQQVDLLVMATKSYDTEAAIKQATPLISSNTHALSLQNGYGNPELIHKQFPGTSVVTGVTTYAAQLREPGKVEWTGKGQTLLGPPSAFTQELAENLVSCGISAEVSEDIEKEAWKKLVINAAINPAGAIFGLTNGELLGSSEAMKLMQGIVGEAEQVLKLNNTPVLNSFQRVKEVALQTRANRNSMLRDLDRGKQTEVDYINGVICGLGKKLGVPTPLNEFAVKKIKELEASSSARAT
ncbi:ketopantoate reductase family protein [archaeon]